MPPKKSDVKSKMPKSASFLQARAVSFTTYNYTENKAIELLSTFGALGLVFLIFGEEICPTTRRPHLQGYAEFKTKTRRDTMIKRFPLDTAFFRADGDAASNITYCSKGPVCDSDLAKKFGTKAPNYGKDAKVLSFGTPTEKHQGKRHLDEVREIATTEGMRNVTANYNLQEIRTAERYLAYNERKRTLKPKCWYIHGCTGRGKTTLAEKILLEQMKADGVSKPSLDLIHYKRTSNKWWPLYDAHKYVIIDELREDHFPFSDLLGICGSGPFSVENKGGERQFLATHVVITTVFPPDELFSRLSSKDTCNQLIDRMDGGVIHIPGEVSFRPPVPKITISSDDDVKQLLQSIRTGSVNLVTSGTVLKSVPEVNLPVIQGAIDSPVCSDTSLRSVPEVGGVIIESVPDSTPPTPPATNTGEGITLINIEDNIMPTIMDPSYPTRQSRDAMDRQIDHGIAVLSMLKS